MQFRSCDCSFGKRVHIHSSATVSAAVTAAAATFTHFYGLDRTENRNELQTHTQHKMCAVKMWICAFCVCWLCDVYIRAHPLGSAIDAIVPFILYFLLLLLLLPFDILFIVSLFRSRSRSSTSPSSSIWQWEFRFASCICLFCLYWNLSLLSKKNFISAIYCREPRVQLAWQSLVCNCGVHAKCVYFGTPDLFRPCSIFHHCHAISFGDNNDDDDDDDSMRYAINDSDSIRVVLPIFCSGFFFILDKVG